MLLGASSLSVRLQVGEVTGIMRQNVEKVLDRGDKLDDLVDKTEDLQASVSPHSSELSKLGG